MYRWYIEHVKADCDPTACDFCQRALERPWAALCKKAALAELEDGVVSEFEVALAELERERSAANEEASGVIVREAEASGVIAANEERYQCCYSNWIGWWCPICETQR